MVNTEKCKYMEPKLSYSLRPLILPFQINISNQNYAQPITSISIQNKGIAKPFKTVSPYGSVEDNKPSSQSLCVDNDFPQNKPSTAVSGSRIRYGDSIPNKNKFIPMALKYSMVVPSTESNSSTHSRGTSLDRNAIKKRGHLIASILRYAQ
jgi:hypothetical protein